MEPIRELDHYKSHISKDLKNIKEDIRKSERVDIYSVKKSSHTLSWLAKFRPEDRKIFCKRFFSNPEETGFYAYYHDPGRLYVNEKRNTETIYSFAEDAVPKLLGYDDKELVIFFEYLEGKTDHDKLIKIAEKSEENEKLNFLNNALEKIVRFNGLINLNKDYFPEPVKNIIPEPKEIKVGLLLDRLFTIKKYGDARFNLENADKFKEKIQEVYQIDVFQEVAALVDLKNSLKTRLELQHGDCRTQHLIGENTEKKFVDLEYVGLYPWTHDLVTYLSVEGDLAFPPLPELPKLLNYCFALHDLYCPSPEEPKNTENGRLLEESTKKIGRGYNQFIMDFLIGMIEEQIHLDACNKRYDEKHLESLIKDIPNYSLDNLKKNRLEKIKDFFQMINGMEDTLKDYTVENPTARTYLYRLGSLLNQIEIVSFDSNLLNKMKNGVAP